jgi:hypothetical protein
VAATTIDPFQVRFSQSSVRNTFKNGQTIDDLATALRSGDVVAASVPPIRLIERDGILYALDNRRLEVFRRARIDVPYRMATLEERLNESWKFTTTNEGMSIRIRG